MTLTFTDHIGRVKLDAEPLATIEAHRQRADDATEAGGVLIGRCIVDTSDVVVDAATTPLFTDERERFRFHRSEPHMNVVHAMHDATWGRVGYVGEWHTHAEPDPTPSDIDLDDWRAQLALQAHLDSLVFVIVGQERTRAWHIVRGGDITPMYVLPLVGALYVDHYGDLFEVLELTGCCVLYAVTSAYWYRAKTRLLVPDYWERLVENQNLQPAPIEAVNAWRELGAAIGPARSNVHIQTPEYMTARDAWCAARKAWRTPSEWRTEVAAA